MYESMQTTFTFRGSMDRYGDDWYVMNNRARVNNRVNNILFSGDDDSKVYCQLMTQAGTKSTHTNIICDCLSKNPTSSHTN